MLALAADELSTRKVTLISRMPDEPLIANVDADLLKQAVLNVIQNGAQAMPEGGRLEVILEEDRKSGEASASLAPANGLAGDKSAPSAWKSAVLRIADEGPGIPEEIREKIFDLVLHHQERRQRHRAGHDLPHPAVTSRERGRTIERGPRHGISAANSARRRGAGTPASAAGER